MLTQCKFVYDACYTTKITWAHHMSTQNPECGRTVSALLQEHNRHPELFGPVLPKSPPTLDSSSQTPQITEHSEPLPPWEPEDEDILLEFIRQHPQITSADWELLQGKVRSLSYEYNQPLTVFVFKSPRRPPQVGLSNPPNSTSACDNFFRSRSESSITKIEKYTMRWLAIRRTNL